jgi:predicted dehydrogenase
LLDIAGCALHWQADRIEVCALQRASQRRSAGAAWYRQGNTLRAGALDYDTDDQFSAALKLDGSRVGLRVAWVDEERGDLVRLLARGERGEAVLSGLFGFSDNRRDPEQQVTLRLGGRDAIRTAFPIGSDLQLRAFAALLRHFHRCIRAGCAEEADALQFAATLGDALGEPA